MIKLLRRFLFVAVCIALPLAAQKLPLGQVVVTHVFNGPTDSPDPQFGLIELANGNFAGVTQGNAQNRQSTRMLYEMTPDGTVTPLITFGPKRYQLTNRLRFPNDGTFSLIQASDGNFYGATNKSGANSAGNVYRLTPSGEYTVLYVFDSGPFGGLAEGLDGGLYGTAYTDSGFGLYRIDLASGTVTFVYNSPTFGLFGTPVFGTDGSFTVLSEELSNPYEASVTSFDLNTLTPTVLATFPNPPVFAGSFSDPIVVEPNGSVFLTQPSENETTYGLILEAAGGKALIPYTFTDANDVANPVSLISASDGNLYGVTFNNLQNTEAQQVFQFNPSSGTLTTYPFPAAAGLNSNGPLLQDSNGYLRGTSGGGAGTGSPGAAFALNLGLPKPLPAVLGFSPSSGPAGTSVKVLGSHFVNVSSVTLAGQAVTFTNPIAGAVFFTVPENATSGSVVITTGAGSGTSAGVFQVQ